MTDLLHVLPDFATKPFSHLLPSLDKHHVTVSDLVTLDATDIAKRAQLPPNEVRKLAEALVVQLHSDLGFNDESGTSSACVASTSRGSALRDVLNREWQAISTLDSALDDTLGGGIPRGYLTEITGESGAGKTQCLLTLLLSVQLPPPRGLSKASVYISTEAALSTSRLSQLLNAHPELSTLPPSSKPSLSKVLSIQTPDLESQDHILRYQLPVAIQRHNIGLVVIDSIAANYRAEFDHNRHNRDDRSNAGEGKAMAARRSHLVQLGALLRDLARTEGIAVVVANQVADRFGPAQATALTSASISRTPSHNDPNNVSLALSNLPPTQSPQSQPQLHSHSMTITPDPLSLDHQQRWFTGWGDWPAPSTSGASSNALKTPSLGLVWTNQIAARIALIKAPVYAPSKLTTQDDQELEVAKWRRWMKLVFAPWQAPSEGNGTEFEILKEGLKAVEKGNTPEMPSKEA